MVSKCFVNLEFIDYYDFPETIKWSVTEVFLMEDHRLLLFVGSKQLFPTIL